MNFIIDELSGICMKYLHMICRVAGKIIKKEFNVHNNESIQQFVRFGIVGISNTLISYVCYVLVLIFFKIVYKNLQYGYIIAGIISFFVSATWSYYWNNKRVFCDSDGRNTDFELKGLLKTYVAYSFTGFFLNAVLLYIWVDCVGISALVAPILNLCISVPLNFLINKKWTFDK